MKTMKAFRNQLNLWYKDAYHQHHRYRQLKRAYGDYLYFQDRERFNLMFSVWTPGEQQNSFERKL